MQHWWLVGHSTWLPVDDSDMISVLVQGLNDVSQADAFGDTAAECFFDMMAVLRKRHSEHKAASEKSYDFTIPGVPVPLQSVTPPGNRMPSIGPAMVPDVHWPEEDHQEAQADVADGVLQMPGGDGAGLLQLLRSWPGHAESEPGVNHSMSSSSNNRSTGSSTET